MNTLLRHRIETLLLSIDCPFPSEMTDMRKAVRDWREYQKPSVPGDMGDDDLIDFDRYEDDL